MNLLERFPNSAKANMKKPYLSITSQSIQRSRRNANICRGERDKMQENYHQLLRELNLKEENAFKYIENCLTRNFPDFKIRLHPKIKLGTGHSWTGNYLGKRLIWIKKDQPESERVKSLFHELLHFHPKINLVYELNGIKDIQETQEGIIENLAQETYRKRSDLVRMASDKINKLEVEVREGMLLD